MMTYDVVIIGAGPAGASLCYLLSKNGLNVALVDRAIFPRDKLCGGFLTCKTLDIISELGLRENNLGKSIEAVSVFYKGEISATFRLLSPARVVCRREFDELFVDAAASQGATLLMGSELATIDFPRKTACLKDGTLLRYDNLVGADGAQSKVRRLVGHPCDSLGFCVESFVPPEQIKQGVLPDMRTIGIFYGDNAKGYSWVFPNHKSVAIGTGALIEDISGKEVLTQHNAFAASMLRQGQITVRGAYIPSGNSVDLGTEDVLFVGDAAGIIDPITGEGIYYALLSSKKLAESFLSGNDPLIAYKETMSPVLHDISENVRMRNRIYSPLVFRNAIATMQCVPQFSETLIDQTILKYEKSYGSAYEELSFYSR